MITMEVRMTNPVNLSGAAKEAMYGIATQKQILAQLQAAALAGRRNAIWDAMMFCIQFQLIQPEWLRTEMERIDHGVRVGEFDTLDEAFGIKLPSKGKRQRAHLIEQQREAVIDLLFRHRTAGGSLNAEEAFEPVAQQLRISRKLVERIYKNHGHFLKDIPQNQPDKVTYAVVSGHSRRFKQYGRPVHWEDEQDMENDQSDC
jgi:hypothetical protein